MYAKQRWRDAGGNAPGWIAVSLLPRSPSRPTGRDVTEERASELLARERECVERALAALDRHEDPGELAHVDQHPADVATEVFDEELEAGLVAELRERLAAIERAEQRLEEGTYGLSVESGQPIPDARLEAIPWAERTMEEQARYDRGVA
jgi:RNA polymerase-binding transcription factor